MPRVVPSSLVVQRRIPDHQRRYFEGTDLHPFETDVDGFSAANAYWLAEFSFLAFSSKLEFVRSELERAGFSQVEIIAAEGTQATFALADDFAVLAFRGTMINEPKNLIADIRIDLADFDGLGKVHSGFKGALEVVWPELEKLLRKQLGNRRLFFTGASLGAALATLAAARWASKEAALYTYGSPRVGTRSFRDSFLLPDHPRIVNENDIITVLPPPVAYRHVGRLVNLRADGTVDDRAGFRGRLSRNLERRIPGVLARLSRPRELMDFLVRENIFTDHTPISYTVRTWNHLEATRRTGSS